MFTNLVYYRDGMEIKIRQGKKSIRQSSKKVTKYGAVVVFSSWTHGCIVCLALMGDNRHRLLLTREAHLSLSDQTFYWGLMTYQPPDKPLFSSPSRGGTEATWPQTLIVNHIVRLSSGQNKDILIRYKISRT